ncbi:MAG: HAMP domain-containing protein [Desulfuromonadales bacterium]|nr:HAMP domain-containing protein [Desulfuromonadales bacterium]
MKAGLRTEVVVSITLLLGAALLFSGFLLVKLTERGLLDQQRSDMRRTVSLLGSALGELSHSKDIGFLGDLPSLKPVLTSLGLQEDVVAWRVLDREMRLVAEMTVDSPADFLTVPPAAVELREVFEELRYSSSWNPFRPVPDNFIEFVMPFGSGGSAAGILQVRFSLAALSQRVHKSQKLVMVYVLLYGGVLSIFGVYTLNRNVVRPVRKLQQATTGVAAGELQMIDVPDGPGEIKSLAESFNHMVEALAQSRDETQEHIASLEEANRAVLQARDDLLRSEKMASVGHLSAGMAHEIGNPLSAIVGYLNLLKEDLSDPASREMLERSLVETDRIDLLIRELLDYATPGSVETEEFDPVCVLRESVDMIQHQGLLERVRVEDHCELGAGVIQMNRGQFVQVCVNLLLNARDAMPDGGCLELSNMTDGQNIGIIVRDEGLGMPPETVRQVFEPFYTTKDPGKGTGLGLAVCQRIVADAGGRIEVSSVTGSGSSFTVYLPGSSTL